MSVLALLESAFHQVQAAEKDLDNTSIDSEDDERDSNGASLRFEKWNLNQVPVELVDALADNSVTVSKLSLKSNLLTTLPPLGRLDQLFYLDISHNLFEELPQALLELPNLEILDLSHNKLSTLPPDFTRLTNLKVCSLTDNHIQYIPPVLGAIPGLVFLEIDNNPLIMPSFDIMAHSSEDTFLEKLRVYIDENRQTLDQCIASQASVQEGGLAPPEHPRDRAYSETGLSSRAAKRMGFVMRKTVGTSPIVSNIHGRNPSAGTHGTYNGSHKDSVDSQVSDSQLTISSAASIASSPAADLPLPSWGRSDDNGKPRQGVTIETIGSPVQESPPEVAPDTPDTHPPNHDGAFSPEGLGMAYDRKRSEALSPIAQRPSPPELKDIKDMSPSTHNLFGGLMPSPLADNPSSYFRRLSTLEEEDAEDFSGNKNFIMPVRKVMYALYEFHGAIRRFMTIAQDRIISGKLSPLIFASRANLHDLVEGIENPKVSAQEARQLCAKTVASISDLVTLLQTPDVFERLCQDIDVSLLRSLLMQTFLSFNELHNAWVSLTETSGRSLVDGLNGDLAAADEQLYQQLENATRSSQSVLSLLNDTIARSAIASAETGDMSNTTSAASRRPSHSASLSNPQVVPPASGSTPAPGNPSPRGPVLAAKIRDLSNSCITGVAATRKLKTILDQRSDRGIVDRRKFWDDVNNFLKSIIAILGAAKAAMPDLPLLAEVGGRISTLARVAKEIPPLLEQSSYKLTVQDDQSARQGSGHINGSNQLQHPAHGVSLMSPTLAMPTPLTATLGNAAQAVISPGYVQTPFFQDFRTDRAPSE